MRVLVASSTFVFWSLVFAVNLAACDRSRSSTSDDAVGNKAAIENRGCFDVLESLDGPIIKTGIMTCPVHDSVVSDLWVQKLAPSCGDVKRIPTPIFGEGPDDDHCRTDTDCPANSACVWRLNAPPAPGSGYSHASRCLPAQCKSAADCKDGPCAVSLSVCGVAEGLYCHSKVDLCRSTAACEGDGGICSYSLENHRFECVKHAVCD